MPDNTTSKKHCECEPLLPDISDHGICMDCGYPRADIPAEQRCGHYVGGSGRCAVFRENDEGRCPYCEIERLRRELEKANGTALIEQMCDERDEALAELRQRIEQEPLKYAQMSAQFCAQAEAATVILGERDRLRAALAQISSAGEIHDPLWAGVIAREALAGSPVETTAPRSFGWLCECGIFNHVENLPCECGRSKPAGAREV